VALGAEVIDFIGADVVKHVSQLTGYGEISVMQIKPGLRIVEILVEMVDAVRVEGTGAPDQAVDFIAFPEEKFSQIGAVLSCNAGDECFFSWVTSQSFYGFSAGLQRFL
jgi:hypothetical protein